MKLHVAGRIREVRRLTCPHDCPDRCGLVAEVDDGRVIGVYGDPDHPITQGVICRKVMEYPARIYGPERLLYPMKRTGPKGAGQFERIGWDEAIDTIASRFADIRDRYGADTILRFCYGGTMGMVQRFAMGSRFFNRLGAATHTRTICSAASQAGYAYTMGASRGADPETIPRFQIHHLLGSQRCEHQRPLDEPDAGGPQKRSRTGGDRRSPQPYRQSG